MNWVSAQCISSMTVAFQRHTELMCCRSGMDVNRLVSRIFQVAQASQGTFGASRRSGSGSARQRESLMVSCWGGADGKER
eukprot:3885216-Pyramimonas_sp.AAC.1